MKALVETKLDRHFQPLVPAFREFEARAREAGREIAVSVVRNKGYTRTMRLCVPEKLTEADLRLAERFVKTLLWAAGGYIITVSGSREIYERIASEYRAGGARAFDVQFMQRVYEKPFEVRYCPSADAAPADFGAPDSVGRHLNGCRIGFDAGGSDRKVSAVMDGKDLYSEEVVWSPKLESDPSYQYDGILASMKTAASKLPHVDAIGVSSAGVYIDNRIMVASLFIKVSDEDFEKRVKSMYLDIAHELGDIPIVVANDGDVTALAGAMELQDTNVLGVAMGTSEAGGYVDGGGNITGWLNELAFVPVDLYPGAAVDEWSGDVGCGVKYFSQDAVIKLAPTAGIELDARLSPAEKLKIVQERMAAGDANAAAIYEDIGVYFGYELLWYAKFYDIKHALIMGRVSSGEGGNLILRKAREVLEREDPALSEKIALHIPDEKSRRVGQSIAAASLPEVK